MRRILKYLVIVLGAIGVWRVLAWRRGQAAPIDPLTLILNPDEAKREGRFVAGIKSIQNLRDIGGYVTENGQTVRWGRVYRGASLATLTPEDGKAILALGLKIVCDLRTPEEVAPAPDIIPDPALIEYLHLPVTQETSRLIRLRILLFERHKLGDTLIEAYTRVMVDSNARLVGDILRRVADEKNLPMLIHCSAGKDRTGVVVALLLRLLGVSEKIVIEDYSLSNLYYAYFREITGRIIRQLSYFGISEAEMSPLLMANPATMEAALRHIDANYGSIEAYLMNAAGLDAAAIAQIRANMLE
jgi:protein-tyrosine phosphatase